MRSRVSGFLAGLVVVAVAVAGLAAVVVPVASAHVGAARIGALALPPSAPTDQAMRPSIILPVPAAGQAAAMTAASTGSPLSATAVSPQVAADTSSPVVHASWTGLGASDNGYLAAAPAVSPPDVQVAVGPGHVVEMVNLAVSIWTKQGAFVSNRSLMAFFGVASNEFISDPKVQYDAASQRWFATITDVGALSSSGTLTSSDGQVRLAVSSSSDPTAPWRVVPVPSAATGECLDQPILGVGPTTVILSVNVFSSCAVKSPTYDGAQYWVLSKAELTSGAALHIQSFGPYANTASFHPAQTVGSASAAYMVSANANLASTSTLEVFQVSGTPPSATVTTSNLSVRAIAAPPPAPQPGGSRVPSLDTGDFRVLDAVWSGGNLWLTLSDGCVPSGDTATRSCVRLIEVNTTAGTVAQDFDVGAPGLYYLYPALRVDGQGDLLVVFGYSSSSVYPGLMAAGRVFGDAPNTLDPPNVIQAGTGSETLQCATVCRYGDYFGAGLDPSNTSLVWAAGEFGTTAGWSTRIFSGAIKSVLTLSYHVVYGGSDYAPPEASYILDGSSRTAPLSLAPAGFAVDPGTAWSVTPVLTSLSATMPADSETWVLNGTPSSGIVTASAAENFTYYHEYRMDFGFALSDNRSVPAPMIQVQSFGIARWTAAGQSLAVDAGSVYRYPAFLNQSGAQERWALGTPANGTASAPAAVPGLYYHEYLVAFDYLLPAGASLPAPAVHYFHLGANVSAVANVSAWADAAKPYTYVASLASTGATERIGAVSGAVGTVQGAGTITVTYALQYLLSMFAEPAALLVNVSGAGWYAAGSVATVTATVPPGWEFVAWSGGASGSSSTATVAMDGPANVTALFYAGLTIVAGPGGSVAYAYGNVSGVVPAGSSTRVFAPVGTAITLTEAPSSWTEAFVGWSGGASGTSATAAFTLNGPATVSAAFGTNALVVGGSAAGVIAVIAVALLLVVVARRRKRPPSA